jgi:hypothetical protein
MARRVTIDDWCDLVRDFVGAKTAGAAKKAYAKHKSNGFEWELPAMLETPPALEKKRMAEMSRLIEKRLCEVKAGSDLWSALLSLRDEIHDS